MQWFNNLKIRSKLILGFGTVIVMAVILVAIAITQLININADYETIFAGSVTRRGAANAVQSNVRGYRRVVTSSVMVAPLDYELRSEELANLLSEANAMRDEIWHQLEIYDYSTLNQPGQTDAWRQERLDMSEAARVLFEQYSAVLEAVQAYARLGNHQAAFDATVYGRDIVNALIAETDNMVETANARMYEATAEASATADAAIITVIVLAVVIVLVAMAMALLIASVISKPIHNLVKLTGNVVNGKLNINRKNVSKDEIGQLTWDMYKLVDTVKTIVEDLTKAYSEYMEVGNMHYKIDESEYKNSYKEVIGLVNSLLERTTDDIMSVADVLNDINDGEFKTNLTLDSWPGEWKIMPQTIISLTENLSAVNGDINAMIDAAANKGDLQFQIDGNKYKGNWRDIAEGLNSIAAAVDRPLKLIEVAMDEMKAGNLEVPSIAAKMVEKGFDPDVNSYNGIFRHILSNFVATIGEIASYVHEIAATLGEISGGNLTMTISREYLGDFSAIKDSLNNISVTLNRTMSEITVASEQVLSGAKQISTSAQDLANGAQEQASAIEELNATIDVLNQQTKQNADNASEAKELSNLSTNNAQEGNTSMQEMLAAMLQIKESSSEISKIIKAIQDISFQTNLLALNAAVEAARAGEHGRGFSVVAEEVRNLAGRSQQSAAETTDLIETSNSRVESGSSIAESTSKSLDTIVKNAAEVSELINNISLSSTEQAEAISQVSTGLSQISQVVQSNSAVSEETAAASQELNSQAEILQQLVTYFKL